ncbi:MAG: hypothetical protein U0835_03435 [Isosphaeraceae bacterium]
MVATESRLTVSNLGSAGRSPVQEGPLSMLAISPDGSLVATSCATNADHRLRVWDAVSGRPLLDREIEGEGPVPAAFSADGSLLAVTEDEVTRVYTLAGRKFARVAALAPGPILALALHPSGGDDARATLFAASYPGTAAARRLELAPARGERPGRVVEVGPANDHDVAPFLTPLPAPGSYAFNDAAGRLLVLDPGAKEPRALPDAPVTVLVVSPDGKEAWGVVDDRRCVPGLCPNSSPGRPGTTAWSGLIGSKGQIYRLTVGAGQVVAGLRDGTVLVLNRSDGKPVPDTASHPDPDGDLGRRGLAPGGPVRPGLAGRQAQPGGAAGGGSTAAEGHTGSIRGLAFAEGGRLLVSGATDGTIRLWRVEGKTATPWFTLQSPGGPVESLSITPDGGTLFALCRREHAVRLWDLARLRQEMTALGIEPAR